jgi:hypothetical protein
MGDKNIELTSPNVIILVGKREQEGGGHKPLLEMTGG